MQSVSYWEAWSLWWSGQKLDGMQMWGLPFPHWGRIGKIMLFIGGLIVLLDLIGPERLKNFGNATARTSIRIKKGVDAPAISSLRALGYTLLVVAVAALILTPTLLLLDSFGILSHLLKEPDATAGIEKIGPLVWIVLIFGSMMLAVGVIVNFHLILKILAAVFTRKNPGYPLRWIAFIIFLGGSHFTILTS